MKGTGAPEAVHDERRKKVMSEVRPTASKGRVSLPSPAGTAILAGLLILGVTAAQARPSLYTMTCSEARAFVRNKGAVVVDTAPNVTRRIVADGSYCDRLQRTKPFFGKTRDNPQCRIGLRCATETMSAE